MGSYPGRGAHNEQYFCKQTEGHPSGWGGGGGGAFNQGGFKVGYIHVIYDVVKRNCF